MSSKAKTTAVIDDLNLTDLYEGAANTDQSDVERPVQVFPIVQWVNGSSAQKRTGGVPYTGGWFISETSAGGLDSLPGWTKDVLITRSGQEVPGFFKQNIEVAYLHKRRHWRVQISNERSAYFPFNQWDQAVQASPAGKKPSGALQMLVWVKDLDVLNPVVLTLKGYVSAEITGKRNHEGVLDAFSTRVAGTINNALHANGVKENLPWRAFWLCIGPQTDANGAPIYTKVGQGTDTSTITLPALIGVPKHPKASDVQKLYVGKELLYKLNALWKEDRLLEWAEAWDVPSSPGSDDEDDEARQKSAQGLRVIDTALESAVSGAADLGDEEISF